MYHATLSQARLFWQQVFNILDKLHSMKQSRINQRTNNLVGTNIKKLRLKRNLRNADIVAKLQLEGVEITTSTYSKVESGTNNPSVDLLIALTDILQCDYNAFFAQ